jgi:predicted transcriptional regulator
LTNEKTIDMHKEYLCMSASLPPLSAVRAFDAVSRHLSFTKAGDELGMTQAAVSYQIKTFRRKTRIFTV